MITFIALFNKFVIGLTAFLLMLLPNSGSLQYLHLQQTNNTGDGSMIRIKILRRSLQFTPVKLRTRLKNKVQNWD